MSPIWITVSVREALESYDRCQAGWWTSADGSGQLDNDGATVAEAIAELRERAASTEADVEAIMSGTIEVWLWPCHTHYDSWRRLLDAQTCPLIDEVLADCIAADEASA